MQTTEKPVQHVKGGSFLVESHHADQVFTPEDFQEEHYMMAETAEQFIDSEIMPRMAELETCNNDLTASILKKAGDLGMLAAEIPESYGGLNLSKAAACLVSEKFSRTGGLIVSLGGHCGIGTMPITYFGTQEQKDRYLPKLATGELLAAYALTETSSGSDALSARTKAVLSADGTHYVLNGNKMWITNAGFADVFIVFAKIDGTDFSAFIVERNYPGVSVGAEEKKMGIKSSSTRMLILEDVKVPVENLLGEKGKGHKIAFNILNIGRFKLGAGALGASKDALQLSATYAQERRAFGKSISEFGMIQGKLGEMVVQTFASESMLYRTAGYIDQILHDVKFGEAGAEETILKGIEEYAIECAMVKVFCSEVLDKIADEAVQIHGGYGYSQEYTVERIYRDARINRIFEGTNEINRMLTIDMLMKRAQKGAIPLMQKAAALMGELMGPPSFDFDQAEGLLVEELKLIENAKKIFMFVAGAAVQKYMDRLAEEQELLGLAADVLMDCYVM
ncbi:MAG: acyl-CoA dehydrogenase family protein, partial [Acidobacteria bacterium]|nr:acyl-CoA dehydrogenase family protein [Acidobacteriota bacterium]